MSARYAVYYAPPGGSPLHVLGSMWLGRDAGSGQTVVQPPVPDLSGLTSEPRRYGFHATLKAPFELADDRSRASLSAFAEDFASRHAPAPSPRVEIVTLGGFLALAPRYDSDAVQHLAAACVMEFDCFRAPLRADEIARRQHNGITRRQSRLLRNWGYPYVLDQFRFHMTLSNKLAADDLARLHDAASRHFASVIDRPISVDAIAVFCEPHEGAPLVAEERFALAGRSETLWPELWKLSAR